MKYNFDEIIERRGTGCVKHDMMKSIFGSDDLLPMWVADMDFRAPDVVMEALRERMNHEVLGYAYATEGYYNAVEGWLQRHYDISARQDELHFIPGIVAGISFVLQTFTTRGDSVLILTPVYPPFVNVPSHTGHNLVTSKLKIENGRFAIDFDDLHAKAKDCKVLIMSNPHNPAGTVWSKEDLARVADICAESGTLVIADEIHADLTLPGHHHVSYPTVSEAARNNSILFIAPSKTFNIAGLSSSVAYVANEQLRRSFYNYLDYYEEAHGSIFAFIGAQVAFDKGEEWLSQLLEYLAGNVEFVRQFVADKMPKAKILLPEASYLAWLDLSGYGRSHEESWKRLIERAKVALNDGRTFGGEDYSNCFRLNIGCPRAIVKDALERIARAMM